MFASEWYLFFPLSPVHAAVFAINEAVDKGEATVTMGALKNPNAMLRNTGEELAQDYQVTLSWAKASKEDQASGRVRNSESLPVVVLSTQESVKKSLSQMASHSLSRSLLLTRDLWDLILVEFSKLIMDQQLDPVLNRNLLDQAER